LYETGAGALQENEANKLAEESANLLTFSDVATGVFTVPSDLTATVGSQFTEWAVAGTVTATDGELGRVDHDLGVSAGSFVTNVLSVAYNASTLFDASQVMNVTGDFTFGSWYFDDEFDAAVPTPATCASSDVALTLNTAKDTASTAGTFDVTAANYTLCAILDGDETALKGPYAATLVDDALTGSLGSIVYDTTTIEVPYITTNTSYNQRLYIVNTGVDALYTISFYTEDGIMAGDMYTGTAEEGEVTMLRVADIVELTGGTRAAAVIEIEQTDSDVFASTQVVNKATGGTDTVKLN
jgi:hypothetical protein